MMDIADLPRKLTLKQFRAKYPGSDDMDAISEALFDSPGFMGGDAVARHSGALPGVDENAMGQLDAMLNRHGLRAVLKTVRELCDARCAHESEGIEFDDMESGEDWKAAATEVEMLTMNAKVNVR